MYNDFLADLRAKYKSDRIFDGEVSLWISSMALQPRRLTYPVFRLALSLAL